VKFRQCAHLIVACALSSVLASCGQPTNTGTNTGTNSGGGAAGGSTIAIDGSSTVFPLTEAVAEEFQKEKQGKVKVTVGISGTGGGFKKFVRGETDISNASRPISKEEMDQAKAAGIQYVELPIAFDALTVVVNPQNDWAQSITVDELKKIWEPEAQGKINNWNQIRPEWPNEKIVLFGAGSDSGTFDYFTEAVVGKAKSSRGDYTASEDDNTLVQGIAGNKYALGYLPYAYFAPNQAKLKALGVQWAKNSTQDPVMPTLENVVGGTYNPLSRPLFIYVNIGKARPEVKEFVDFYLRIVPQLAEEVRYLPLPAGAYTAATERFKNNQAGTAFGGHSEVGLKVEDILKRTPQL
jgi:phosphate transport system substrate-binding protein